MPKQSQGLARPPLLEGTRVLLRALPLSWLSPLLLEARGSHSRSLLPHSPGTHLPLELSPRRRGIPWQQGLCSFYPCCARIVLAASTTLQLPRPAPGT